MKCNLRLLLAALTGLMLSSLAPAQVLDARPIGAMPARPAEKASAPARATGVKAWPAVRPPLATRTFNRRDDDRGLRGFTQFRFPAVELAFDNEPLSDWRKLSTPSRYAVEWSSRWTPDLVFGLAELPATSFPTPLDAAAWQAYLRSLRQQYGSRLRLHVDDDSDANTQMLRPLVGGRTRVLEYEVAPEKPEDPARRVVQVFMIAPGGVVVAGCEGPAPAVVQFQHVFASLLMRMEAESIAEPVSPAETAANRPVAPTPVRGG